MTKRGLARESGVSYRTICRICSGDMVGSFHTWAKLAKALGSTVTCISGR